MASTVTPEAERPWQNWDKGSAAERIDAYWLQREARWRRMLVRDLRKEFAPGVPMLEAGCGSGLIYGQMEQAGLVSSDSYTGGDVSQNMLAIARSRFPKARFVDLDIFAIAYPARHWPTVISVHVLQHLPHYEQALLELMRVTAGKLYVVSWFDRGSEDKITFSPPSSKWDGQSFHNNNYSLAKFLDFIRAKSDRPIERLRVHRFFGPTYGISVTFDRRLAGSPPEGLLSRWTSGFRNLFGSRRAKPAQ